MKDHELAIRQKYRESKELIEPGLVLNLDARGGDPTREFKHLHQMCMLHSLGFRAQNEIKMGYLIQAYVTAAEAKNPIGVFATARAALEQHAFLEYVARRLEAVRAASAPDWRARGMKFFDVVVRAKFGTSDPQKTQKLAEQGFDAPKPYHVITCLEHLAKQVEFTWAQAHYDFLCDYLHPNLSSQTVAVTGIRMGTHVRGDDMRTLLSRSPTAIQNYEYPSTAWSSFAIERTSTQALANVDAALDLLRVTPDSPFRAEEVLQSTGSALGMPFIPPSSSQRPESGAPRPTAVGRNDVCPCGSGKKYKKCHGV
jgi:hypothetical protein